MRRKELFFWLTLTCGIVIVAYILLPLVELMTSSSIPALWESIHDKEVVRSIRLSVFSAGSAALISFLFGTPLAFLLARQDFRGKRLLEAIIDLPIVIPHPVVGIAILGIAGKNHWIGRLLFDLGIRIMGSVTGIIVALTFVGIPFYIHSAKAGFMSVPPRLEKVSRSLGASMTGTFFRITFPLAWRGMLIGIIMCSARAISEFGAVVVIAYHPMTAPVLIYERFEAYGLKYSQPVAVWLVIVSLFLFLFLRILTTREAREK